MSLLLIQTGHADPLTLARAGDFDRMFLVALGLEPGAVQVVRVCDDEPLPDRHDYKGILITGSPKMVTDRLPWSERTAAWLRAAQSSSISILGVCYGHQLLAHALGGEIINNPRGPEYGPTRITLRAEAAADSVFSALSPYGETLYTAHSQTIAILPKQAVSHAFSVYDDNQAVRFNVTTWGVQFHPEFTAIAMRSILENAADQLTAAGLDASARQNDCTPTIEHSGRRLLKRFIDVCKI